MATASPEPSAGRAPGTDPDEVRPPEAFPVVGVGASAGGLEAFRALLRALPPKTGMAFVFVQHLSPAHASLLADILGRETAMPVVQVEDEPTVRPDHVYVIPPNRNMVMREGALNLLPRLHGPGQHRPVDDFLRSLAEDRTDQAVGVILSGTGTDGSVGLEAIKAVGGITFAQDDSAQHEGMPRSAIATGCVDFVLPPEQIAAELERIGRHPYALPTPAGPIETPAAAPPDEETIEKILRLLHDVTGVDFTHYKSTTLYRRINRRMLLLKLDGLDQYLRHLQGDAAEARNLYRDILISVTRFFRDPEAYDTLKRVVFPRLFLARTRQDPVRLWVLGCSTGEEAYSLAIALHEYATEAGLPGLPQVFATDLNEHGVQKARQGLYAKTIAQDVSPERLRKYFVETEAGYQIAKSVRELCVFARQNVLADPPFSRLDLITCRNLLIYMEPVLQRKIMPLFHYALKPGGYLWLGTSETVGNFSDLFQAEDTRHKIYSKKPNGGFQPLNVPLTTTTWQTESVPRPRRVGRADAGPGVEAQREADRLVLARYTPPGVLVNADLDILQFRGDTSPYLASAPGKPSVNVLKMAREGLLVGLRSALQRVVAEGSAVRLEDLEVRSNGGQRAVNLEVLPLRGGADEGPCYLVLFEPAGTPTGPAARSPVELVPLERDEAERQVARLTQELAATREYLQSLIEQQEAANEELQSANEEVQSSNEELQSINEELQTSKEEIQSTNEELQTINEEMRHRNDQLARANDDLTNFLGSTHLALVMLGPDRRIRHFTPHAERILRLLPTDLGRPLGELNLPLDVPDLGRFVGDVMAGGRAHEQEVRDRDGHWYSLRLRPHRTADDRVEGAVLVLVDIDAQKRSLADLQASEEKYRLLVAGATGVALILLDPEGRVAVWNVGAERLFGYAEGEIVGESFRRFFTPEDVAAGRPERELEQARTSETADDDCWLVRKDGSRFWASGVVTALRDGGQVRGFSKIIRDGSERKAVEDALRESEQRFRLLADSAPVLIWLSGLDGREFVNRAYLDFLGATQAELRGDNWLDFVHPDDRAACRAVYQEAVAGGSAYQTQFRFRRADGAYRWMKSVGVPRREAAGQVVGFVGCSFDIEDLKRAEDTLRRSHDELERRVAERTDALRESNATLAALLRRLVTAQEDERRRIARELHDQMGQLLAALILGLKSLEGIPADAPARARELQTLADQIGREVHDLALELRPPSLDDLGLAAALAQQAELWSKHAGIGVDVHTGGLDGLRLPPEVETALYRAVQEALTNVARHAGASRVSLIVERQDGQLVTVVEDDGRGFDAEAALDPHAARTRLGLLGMRERLAAVGGTLDIESSAGQGTTVFARVPLPEADEGGEHG